VFGIVHKYLLELLVEKTGQKLQSQIFMKLGAELKFWQKKNLFNLVQIRIPLFVCLFAC